jgi:Ca2+-binding RTX toxin-like protein
VPERKRYRGARAGALAVALSAALLVLPGAASANVTTSLNGGALSVSSDAGDAIDITCVGTPGDVKVNGIDPTGGPAACSTITSITVEGGPDGNAINLNGVTDELFTGLTSVTVNGNGGNDTILGSEINDVLNGGDGIDRLVGFRNVAPTRDVMVGGEGDDTLVWNNGDGSDTMDGENGNDTIEVNGGTAAEQFTIVPSATTPGRFSFDRVDPGPFNLDIGTAERLDLNANAGDDSLNAAGGVAGLNPFVIDADGGDGNDLLNGGDAADVLNGGTGIDRLVAFRNPAGTRDVMAGGEGDDTNVWNNGDGSDTMEGENGNDTTEVNGGTADEEFTVEASQTPGRVNFNRVNPGPFNLDIGTTENLQLNANAGDDELKGAKRLAGLIVSTLNGDDNSDFIKGTDAEDLLSGGKGFDVIRSRDRAEDRVECGPGIDIAFVDKRDVVRGCELVLGGRLKVRLARKSINVVGGAAVLPLKCVVAQRCKGTARLRLNGKTLGRAKFNIGRKKAKKIRLRLNRRGLRMMAGASAKGVRVQLRIKATDTDGNGWETRPRIRLKG